MLHVMSARCVACFLHTIMPWPLERTCWRQFAARWGDCRNLKMRVLMRLLLLRWHLLQLSHHIGSHILSSGKASRMSEWLCTVSWATQTCLWTDYQEMAQIAFPGVCLPNKIFVVVVLFAFILLCTWVGPAHGDSLTTSTPVFPRRQAGRPAMLRPAPGLLPAGGCGGGISAYAGVDAGVGDGGGGCQHGRTAGSRQQSGLCWPDCLCGCYHSGWVQHWLNDCWTLLFQPAMKMAWRCWGMKEGGMV